MQPSLKWASVLFISGALLLIGGGVMIPVVDMLVREKIKQTVVIDNSSELWDIWSELPVPIFIQFYMFNLSNPLEVKQGQRPVVVQSGPYTYRERRKKYDIVFNNNGTVTYRQRRTFFFYRNMSVGDDTDLFTVANPPVLAVINSMQYESKALREGINAALKLYAEDIFMTRSVKEILWGYTDPALKTLNRLFPTWFYTDFVGYFINKNDTDDGLYTVFTGSKSVKHLGQIDQYNGSRYLPYWSSPWANMINGSDGTISPPFEQDAVKLPMFSSDVCRSVYGVYQKDVKTKTKQSISLRRFVGSPEELENATANPDNGGFCTPQNTCLPSGLLNISNCQIVDYFHIPAVMSFPHFYMADPRVIDSIGGMHPVPEEHETAVDVEPWTGLVLQAYKRLQINMYITKVNDVSLTANIPTAFLPVFWLNESAVVDDKHAKMLQDQLFTPLEITSILEKVFMAMGTFLVMLAMIVIIKICRKSGDKRDRLPGTVPVRSGRPKQHRRPLDRRDDEREPLLNEHRRGDLIASPSLQDAPVSNDELASPPPAGLVDSADLNHRPY